MGERRDAVGVFAVLPRVPACFWRSAQALLQAPGPLSLLDVRIEAERPARYVRHGLAYHGDPHRHLHHGGLRRMDQRPSDLQLGFYMARVEVVRSRIDLR